MFSFYVDVMCCIIYILICMVLYVISFMLRCSKGECVYMRDISKKVNEYRNWWFLDGWHIAFDIFISIAIIFALCVGYGFCLVQARNIKRNGSERFTRALAIGSSAKPIRDALKSDDTIKISISNEAFVNSDSIVITISKDGKYVISD